MHRTFESGFDPYVVSPASHILCTPYAPPVSWRTIRLMAQARRHRRPTDHRCHEFSPFLRLQITAYPSIILTIPQRRIPNETALVNGVWYFLLFVSQAG